MHHAVCSLTILSMQHVTYSYLAWSLSGIVKRTHNIVIPVNEDFLFICQDNFASAILGQKHCVTNVHHCFTNSSIFKGFAWSHSQDRSLVQFLFLARCKNNSALCFGNCLGLSHDYAIQKGSQCFEREHFSVLK